VKIRDEKAAREYGAAKLVFFPVTRTANIVLQSTPLALVAAPTPVIFLNDDALCYCQLIWPFHSMFQFSWIQQLRRTLYDLKPSCVQSQYQIVTPATAPGLAHSPALGPSPRLHLESSSSDPRPAPRPSPGLSADSSYAQTTGVCSPEVTSHRRTSTERTHVAQQPDVVAELDDDEQLVEDGPFGNIGVMSSYLKAAHDRLKEEVGSRTQPIFAKPS
jgi:hypothetical protein